MPTRLYHPQNQESAQVRITWEPGWRNMSIWFNETSLATIAAAQDMKTGQSVVLPDGSRLFLQITRPYREQDLVVSVDGARLYGLDPALPDALRVVHGTVFVVAGFLILLGAIALIFQAPFLVRIGIGPYSLFFGVLILLLGILVRRNSLPALILTTILVGAHCFIGIAEADIQGSPTFGSIVLHVLLGIPIFRGVFAFDAWSRQFPPPPPEQRKRALRRNLLFLGGVLLLPIILLVIALWLYPTLR